MNLKEELAKNISQALVGWNVTFHNCLQHFNNKTRKPKQSPCLSEPETHPLMLQCILALIVR
jgi:hypothetical protein